jgi:uncharacterized membrane protein YsdA (DUF1294 family)
MLILIRVLVITYIVAINVYSFLLIFFQKKQMEENSESKIKDGKVFISGMLGGALGVYLAMFILSYRLNNLFLMVTMPILIVLTAYIVIVGFQGNFGFVITEQI